MDRFFNKNCEKESTEIRDCIARYSNVGVWAPYECVSYFKLYDKCIQRKKNLREKLEEIKKI